MGFLPISKSDNFIKTKYAFQSLLYQPKKYKQKIKRWIQLRIGLNLNEGETYNFFLIFPISINVSFKALIRQLNYLP